MVSALVVAVFWGANIGAVYPVVEVVLQDRSMQQWVDEKIADSQTHIAATTADLDRMRRRLDELGQQADRGLEWEIANAESKLSTDQWALQAYQRAKPLIDSYLPNDPFRTLVLITGLLALGTLIKDVFLVANNVLSARPGPIGHL